MKFDKGRDLEHAGEVLEQWLCHRLDLASATVSDLVLPDRAGLSNETILFRADAPTTARTTTTEDLVVRISPAPEYQLLRDTLFEEQARLAAGAPRRAAPQGPEGAVVRGRIRSGSTARSS